MSQPLSVFLTEVTSAPSKSPLNFISDFDSSLSSPLRAKSCAVALNLSESPSGLSSVFIMPPSDEQLDVISTYIPSPPTAFESISSAFPFKSLTASSILDFSVFT